jgi:hypothetical protein
MKMKLNSILAALLIYTQLFSPIAEASKIQQQGIKTLADCTAAGATGATCLPLTAQVWDSTNGQQLSASIANGQIGGGGGAKNYLTQYKTALGTNTGNGDFENGTTTGFTLAHSVISTANGYPLPTSVATAGSAFSASSGGTAAAGTLSLTASTSSPLQKTTSGLLTSSAASTAGDMIVSSAFYIDAADQGKMLTVSADTSVVSGTINQSGTSSNTFSWWIYDVTAAQWIQPAGVYNITGSGQTKGVTFQTSVSSTQYQLALINTTATAAAYSFKVDELAVGPQVSNSAPAMSDPIAYTPTFTGFGTVSGISAYSWRVGSTLRGRITFVTGTATASSASVTIGYGGVSGNVASASSYAGTTVAGKWNRGTVNSTDFGQGTVITTAGNSFLGFAGNTSTTNGLTQQNGSVIASTGNTFQIDYEVQIQGWSSNSVSSADTDTRVVAAYIQGSSIANAATYTFGAATVDTAGGWNGSTTYTVPVSGIYEIGGQMQFTQTSTAGSYYNMGVFKNGSGLALQTKRSNGASTGTDSFPFSTIQAQLKAGDTLTFGMAATNYSTITPSTDTSWFSIKRLSGPAVVQASESVNMRYSGTTGQTIAAGGNAPILFNVKNRDSHAQYNPATGQYTIVSSGMFQISASASTGSTSASGNALLLIKNGSQVAAGAYAPTVSGGSTPTYSDCYPFLAGDVISINWYNPNAGSVVLSTASTVSSFFSVARLGN